MNRQINRNLNKQKNKQKNKRTDIQTNKNTNRHKYNIKIIRTQEAANRLSKSFNNKKFKRNIHTYKQTSRKQADDIAKIIQQQKV
jgi:hypothetical protein